MPPPENAIDAIRGAAASGQADALRRWDATAAGELSSDRSLLETAVWSAGRVTVNFHPDRVARSGSPVAEGLAESGQYLSQWRTGISSGGRTAFPGGDRQRWESQLFGGAYDSADPGTVAFPIYGSWDLLGDPHGGSPRFGSCYLVLDDDVRDRTTMCVGDSHVGPIDVGTFDAPWSVLAGLAEQADDGGLLATSHGGPELLEVLLGSSGVTHPRRDLDNYVETQVHGGIDLRTDVVGVVLDPSFAGTPVDDAFEVVSSRFGVEIEWHAGSELLAADAPVDFRGPTMPALAAAVAGPDDIVDANAIGLAARRLPFSEMQVRGDDPHAQVQQLKYLWHTLLAHGVDARPVPETS